MANGKRYVWQAQYNALAPLAPDTKESRVLTIVAPHFKRASSLAVTNAQAGEELVSVEKVEGAVA